MDKCTANCKSTLLKFEKENPMLIKSPVFTSFVADEENKKIYEKAICYNKKEDVESLETNFRRHYFNLRFISYFSKTIHFYAINFDMQERKHQERSPLILNSYPKGDNDLSLLEIIPDDSRVSNPEDAFEDGLLSLEDIVTDEKIYKAICTLTSKQKEILKLKYIEGLNDTDIAKSLNITQQAVSKSHKRALLKLKTQLY